MELSQAQVEWIEDCLPRQRGNVSLSNRQVLSAILYMANHGCPWRSLPASFGNWHTVYTRVNRWSKRGVLDRVFLRLQQLRIVRIRLESVTPECAVVGVDPSSAPTPVNTASQGAAAPVPAGQAGFVWLPRILGRG